MLVEESRDSVAIGATLSASMTGWSATDPGRASIASAIEAIAGAARQISEIISAGPLAGALGDEMGGANADGDRQRRLDVVAHDFILDALRATATAFLASEEEEEILVVDPAGDLAIAVDPLDGSSNIDANISIGTIFSIHRASTQGPTASFFRPGSEQLAAGYVVYGPHTALVLTVGEGVDLFVLDPGSGAFRLVAARLAIPKSTKEFAINASNARHWRAPVRTFIDDCLAGAVGPRQKDFNMRWVASLVAEAHRIFMRGGVFLYPADDRPGYERGRLRLVYEAQPIALLVEQAGGAATDGLMRILDKIPAGLHERTPLVFGSIEKVARIADYHKP